MESTPSREASLEGPLLQCATPPSQLFTPDSGYCGSDSQDTDNSHLQSPTFTCSVERPALSFQDDSMWNSSFLGSIPVASYKGSRSAPRHRWSREGRLRIDFLRELQHYEPVLSMLFQFLSDKDLAAIGRTSSLWRKLCTTLPVARNRWKLYLESKRDAYECSRENLPSKKLLRQRSADVLPLSVVSSNQHRDSIEKQGANAVPCMSNFQIFIEEAKLLQEGEWHLRCPQCGYPSRVSKETKQASCKSAPCGYEFCSTCRAKPHGQLPCVVHSPKQDCGRKKNLIGGAYSKRQLRRL